MKVSLGNDSFDLSLTYGALKAIKSELAIDLGAPEVPTKPGEQPLATALLNDPLLVAEIAVAILRKQLTAAGRDPAVVIESLSPGELGALVNAFWDEYRFFFQALKHPFRLAAIEKSIQMLEKAAALVETVNLDSAISGTSQTSHAASSESRTSTG